MAILDLSKLLMYDFHYNYMLKNIILNQCLQTLIDIFYEIKTDDVYEDLLKDKELFDNSDCQKKTCVLF